MKMKKLTFFLFVITACSCQHTSKKVDQNEVGIYQEDCWRHLDFLFQLKNDVAKRYWPEFSKKELFQPALYYTKDGTFVLNPNEHIRNSSEYQEMPPYHQLERIALSEKYTDTISFNFSTSYSDSDSTALYFKENVLSFQSFDLTQKLIGITDLQDWSIMVIHELFHGYQRSVPEFKGYYTKLDIPGGPDAFLGQYHKELKWYRESVLNENEILKNIWINGAGLVENLNKYRSLRLERIEKIKASFGVDIREVEDYEIFIEGQARYFESLCKRFLSKGIIETRMLSEEDRSYITKKFEGYEVKKDQGLYDIYNDRYYYQLGYNISMILEKHLPEYRESVYTEAHNFNRFIDILLEKNRE
jgi:hypothetical protein